MIYVPIHNEILILNFLDNFLNYKSAVELSRPTGLLLVMLQSRRRVVVASISRWKITRSRYAQWHHTDDWWVDGCIYV